MTWFKNKDAFNGVVREALEIVQGRAKKRVLDLEKVVKVVDSAKRRGWATTDRISVAGSYGSGADYTSADAYLFRNRIVVAITRGSCSQSTALGLSQINPAWSSQSISNRVKSAADLVDHLAQEVPNYEIARINVKKGIGKHVEYENDTVVFSQPASTVMAGPSERGDVNDREEIQKQLKLHLGDL